MAKKTKVREHERTAPKRNDRGASPEDAHKEVADWMRKQNDKTQEGFKEWAQPEPQKRGKR